MSVKETVVTVPVGRRPASPFALLAIVPILAVEITNQVHLHNERVAAIHAEVERLAALVDDWYQFRAFPSREGLAFYGQDVTEQRRLREDLERQRALLETIIESAPDPIFAKDREGRCITLNSAAARVHGMPTRGFAVPRAPAILSTGSHRPWSEGSRIPPCRSATGPSSWPVSPSAPPPC